MSDKKKAKVPLRGICHENVKLRRARSRVEPRTELAAFCMAKAPSLPREECYGTSVG
jgi:hypothetical protein